MSKLGHQILAIYLGQPTTIELYSQILDLLTGNKTKLFSLLKTHIYFKTSLVAAYCKKPSFLIQMAQLLLILIKLLCLNWALYVVKELFTLKCHATNIVIRDSLNNTVSASDSSLF